MDSENINNTVQEGYYAYWDELSTLDCPYPKGSKEREGWIDGWKSADIEVME